MHATTVAVDLAKDVFELAFADAQHRIIERRRLSRRALARSLDNRGPLNTRLQPTSSTYSESAKSNPGHLQEESIHELLGGAR